jgi:5-dehydro-2-deoxygluconokinase
LNAPAERLAARFRDARASRSCRGFAVGRTIFGDPARRWLANGIGDAALIAAVRANYEALIRAWKEIP